MTFQIQPLIINNFSRVTKDRLNEVVQNSIRSMPAIKINLPVKEDAFLKRCVRSQDSFSNPDNPLNPLVSEVKRLAVNVVMGRSAHTKETKNEFEKLNEIFATSKDSFLTEKDLKLAINSINGLKRGVKDPIIRQHIVDSIKDIRSWSDIVYGILPRLNKLIDIDNAANNFESSLQGNASKVMHYAWVDNLQKELENKKLGYKAFSSIYEAIAETPVGKYPKDRSASTLQASIETEPIKEYIKEYNPHSFGTYRFYHDDFDEYVKESKNLDKIFGDKSLTNYLYNRYYLPTLSPEVKSGCKKIYDKFLTYLFVEDKQDAEIPKTIYDEFEMWREAFKKNRFNLLTLPNTIDINNFNIKFIEDPKTAGNADWIKKVVNLSLIDIEIFPIYLRHELIHLNDHELANGNSYKGHDIVYQKLFREELFNAGIDPGHVDYAHTAPHEFRAVVSQGDYSKYSPKFREMLQEIGFPMAVLGMKPIPLSTERADFIETLRKNHPELNTMDKVLAYLETHSS